jgi:hypothetical protein
MGFSLLLEQAVELSREVRRGYGGEQLARGGHSELHPDLRLRVDAAEDRADGHEQVDIVRSPGAVRLTL